MRTVKKNSTAASSSRLSLRDLNRALLARQLLLRRETLSVVPALEHVAGLQAQLAGPPFVGLWTRLHPFTRENLSGAFASHEVVRAPLMRGTLHAVSSADYARFRSVLEPMLRRSLQGMPADRLKGIDAPALAAEARSFLAASPRTQEDVRNFLAALHPKLDERMMGHAVRLHLPLVQVPEPDVLPWNFPSMPRFALGEQWIGTPLANSADPRPLVRRYLAAFGPATRRDFQTWSGLPLSNEVFESLRPELQEFADEKNRALFDLPGAPRPGGETPAPSRFLPEFDNVLLAHTERTRVVADAHRKQVFLPGLRVAATLLIDGFVAGTWKIERGKKTTTLAISAFKAWPKKIRDEITAEGERLGAFLTADALTEVRFVG